MNRVINEFTHQSSRTHFLWAAVALVLADTAPPSRAAEEGEQTRLLAAIQSEGVPQYLVRNSRGDAVSVTLHGDLATDENLSVLSRMPSIEHVSVQGEGRRITAGGIATLGRLPAVRSLTLACGGTLQEGVLLEVCRLRSLRRLELVAACPPRDEYRALTNLTNLLELRVGRCQNFGVAELHGVTNLTGLMTLDLEWDGFTLQQTNVLARLPNLTNIVIKAVKVPSQ